MGIESPIAHDRSLPAVLVARLDAHRHVMGIWLVLGLLVVMASFLSPTFRTPLNTFNVLRQAVALGLVGAGQTFAVLIGGIDLSVGAMISLTSVLTAGLMQGRQEMMLPVVLLMTGLGVTVGLLNGLVVIRLRVPAFVATLGMMSILQGFVLMYAKRPVGMIAPGFAYVAEGYVGRIPVSVLFLLMVYVAVSVTLGRTAFGRYVYAVGGSEERARLSGIGVSRIKLAAYAISSVSATLSGLFLTGRMWVGDPLVGTGYELDSIATVLLGGTALSGGRGSIWGTLAGVLVMAVLSNTLNLLNVSTYWQWIVKGAIVVAAVGIHRG